MNLRNSNIQISLNDFRSDEIFVYLDKDYKNNLLNAALNKAESQSKLAQLVKENLKYPKISQATISSFLYRKNLRLDFVYWLCRLTDTKFDKNKILGVKGVQTSRMIYHPKLDIALTPELAQILANLYCDGTIVKNNCYTATYFNTCKQLISRFRNNIKETFGEINLYERNIPLYSINLPAFIGKLLYYKYKLYEDKVPIQIIHSSKEIKSAYLQAVFDDEGTIHHQHGQIRLKMKPRSYIEDIRNLIQEFDITTSKISRHIDKGHGRICYFFSISGFYNRKNFYDEISFFHPKKRKRLIKSIENVKTKSYGYNAKYLVYDILKSQGPLTAKQIAKKIDRDKRTTQRHLKNLKNQNLVAFTKLKKKFVYEYLWRAKHS